VRRALCVHLKNSGEKFTRLVHAENEEKLRRGARASRLWPTDVCTFLISTLDRALGLYLYSVCLLALQLLSPQVDFTLIPVAAVQKYCDLNAFVRARNDKTAVAPTCDIHKELSLVLSRG